MNRAEGIYEILSGTPIYVSWKSQKEKTKRKEHKEYFKKWYFLC